MANKTDAFVKGGSFLIDDITPDQVFTLEELTEEQKMIAKTAEDYTNNEVFRKLNIWKTMNLTALLNC